VSQLELALRAGTTQRHFAVPLQLRTGGGLLSLITTITSFATAADVTVSELRLEAFLPGDAATATALRDRAKLGP
jgi:hypothetical protein